MTSHGTGCFWALLVLGTACGVLAACGPLKRNTPSPGPLPGVVEPARCDMTVDRPTGVLADGSDRATVTVTVRDGVGQPMQGVRVTFAASAGATARQPLGNTNAAGQISGTVVSTQAGTATVSATATQNGVPYPLIVTVTVQFIAAPTIQVTPSWGPADGGTLLRITGAGFNSGTTVGVGGNAATGITIVSATELTCPAPAGTAGPVTVTVTTGTLTSALPGGFRYVAWKALGPAAGTVDALAVRPGSTDVLYACTGAGLYKSTDAGLSWDRRARGLATATINGVAFKPGAPDTMWAATAVGLARSDNAGETWNTLGKPVPVGSGNPTQVHAIAVDPANPDRILVGGSPGGVFLSTDGGQTWTARNAGLPASPSVRAFAFDPTDPQRLYYGNSGGTQEGFYISEDGGQTWRLPNLTPPDGQTYALVLDPTAAGTMYLGTTQGLFKSTDNGETWNRAEQGITPTPFTAYALIADPAQPGTLYAACSKEVYVSTDSAATWTVHATGLPGRVVKAVALAGVQAPPAPRLIAGMSDLGIQASDAGGAWADSSWGLHATTVKDLATDPMTAGRLVAASPGYPFVWTTSNGGTAWTAGNAGFTSSAAATGLDPAQPDTVYVATGSQGVWKSDDFGLNFSATAYTQGLTALVVDSAGGITAARNTNKTVVNSTDQGLTWQTLPTQGLTIGGVATLAVDPANPQTVWAGGGIFDPGLFRYDGAAWTDLGTNLPAGNARAVNGMYLADSATIYLATYAGAFLSTDTGATWIMLGTATLSSANTMLPDANHALTLWAGATGAYWSRDGGSTWEAFSAGLEKLAVYRLVADPLDPKRIYAATRGGVYVLEQP